MVVINVFYTGTQTVDYSLKLTRSEDETGILLTSSEHDLENEFFPCDSGSEFIKDYGEQYIGDLDYELFEGGHFTLDNNSDV